VNSPRAGFTLIELLVVIAVIAILSVVVVLSLNPAELLRQSRDSTRLSDMDSLNHALGIYTADQSGNTNFSLGSSNVVYVSLPDSSSTCGNLGLPVLPTGYTYNCVTTSASKNVNGLGWIPVPLSNTSGGSPIGSLPLDPTNQSSSRLYYTYTTNGSQYEITAVMESAKYKLGGTSDAIGPDGGTLATVYEKGSKLGLEPLDYGDKNLAGYWTFDEGSGVKAYDYSGNNDTGTWSGTGTHWGTGKIGQYAATFDSTDDFISMSSVGTGAAAGTVTFWLNTPLNATTSNIAIANVGAFFVGNTAANKLGLDIMINGTWADSCWGNCTGFNITGVTGNQWNFVAVAYSAGATVVYLNGQVALTKSYANGPLSTTGGNWIGKWSNGILYNGTIDDYRIYSRALSATEIAAMYNGGK
jgi:prepilin-type N-terminal cleavage/methylation domain-containing protein